MTFKISNTDIFSIDEDLGSLNFIISPLYKNNEDNKIKTQITITDKYEYFTTYDLIINILPVTVKAFDTDFEVTGAFGLAPSQVEGGGTPFDKAFGSYVESNGGMTSLVESAVLWFKGTTDADVSVVISQHELGPNGLEGLDELDVETVGILSFLSTLPSNSNTKRYGIIVKVVIEADSFNTINRVYDLGKKFQAGDDDVFKSFLAAVEGTTKLKLTKEDFFTTTIEQKIITPLNITIITPLLIDINVNKGWNLIGSSYNSTIEDSDNIVIPNTIYEYDISYKNSSEIKENKGYWIKCNNSGIIKFKYNPSDLIYIWTELGIEKIKENNIIYDDVNSPEVNNELTNLIFRNLIKYNYTTESLLEQKMIKIKDNEITLNEGWNLVGSSYNSTIEDSESIIIPNTIYEYDTSYKSTTEIKENKGYWIKTSKSGKIKLKNNE